MPLRELEEALAKQQTRGAVIRADRPLPDTNELVRAHEDLYYELTL
jgi:hypothetical protein